MLDFKETATGTVIGRIPKGNGTWAIVISCPDGETIYDEMNGVTDKDELPKVGTSYPLRMGKGGFWELDL